MCIRDSFRDDDPLAWMHALGVPVNWKFRYISLRRRWDQNIGIRLMRRACYVFKADTKEVVEFLHRCPAGHVVGIRLPSDVSNKIAVLMHNHFLTFGKVILILPLVKGKMGKLAFLLCYDSKVARELLELSWMLSLIHI